MRTNKSSIVLGLAAALLLVGMAAGQAMAITLNPSSVSCSGTLANAGSLNGAVSAAGQSAITGADKTGKCYLLAGQVTVNLVDGSSATYSTSGLVDGSGGCPLNPQVNGQASQAGQGYIQFSGSGPLSGCQLEFQLTAYDKLLGNRFVMDTPLTAVKGKTCGAAGAGGLFLCVGTPQ